MKKLKYILLCGLMSTSILLLYACKSDTVNPAPSAMEESITKADENAVHDLIEEYFRAIENKDYSTAWELYSAEVKKGYTKEDAIRDHFGLESLKLISLQTYLRHRNQRKMKISHRYIL